MEDNKIWRVKFKYGYYDLVFDFESVDDAANFIITAGKTFKKEYSYDNKDLFIGMSYVDKDKKEEDD